MKHHLLALVTTHLLMAFIPGDPIGEERLFFNIQAPAYQINEAYTLPFNYKSSVNEPAIIEIYLTNYSYNKVNIYTRSIPSTKLFMGTLSLLPFMLDGCDIELWFHARGQNFQIMQPLMVFPRQTFFINNPNQEEVVIINENYGYLDDDGFFKTEREQITLSGFIDMIVSPYYFNLNIDSLSFTINAPKQQNVSIQQLFFQIGDYHRLFPLLNNRNGPNHLIIPLLLNQTDNHYNFSFSDMYVDPITYLISDNPINQFIKTNKLYFPKNKFKQLKEIPLLLSFKIVANNEYFIQLNSTYISERAMFGNCQNAQYCIKINHNVIPDGAIRQVVTING